MAADEKNGIILSGEKNITLHAMKLYPDIGGHLDFIRKKRYSENGVMF